MSTAYVGGVPFEVKVDFQREDCCMFPEDEGAERVIIQVTGIDANDIVVTTKSLLLANQQAIQTSELETTAEERSDWTKHAKHWDNVDDRRILLLIADIDTLLANQQAYADLREAATAWLECNCADNKRALRQALQQVTGGD